MADDLIVPIYIDTNSLLDLLASIEDGFSVVEKVTTRNAASTGTEKSITSETGTEFGIPNVLSLLKIKLGGASNWKKAEDIGHQIESERFHTYGSLLYRLRAHLDYEKLIKRVETDPASWDAIQPSNFVELKGFFRPNPLVDALQIMDRLLRLANIFYDTQSVRQDDKKKNSTESKTNRANWQIYQRNTFRS